MKHKGLAWIAAVAFSVLTALPFTGRAEDSAAIFDKTTAPLEKGGISFSFTNGEAAYQMVGRMFESFNAIIPEGSDASEILEFVQGAFNDLGLDCIVGTGTSVKKVGDYYRCKNFLYAPESEREGMLWDFISASTVSKGAPSELKLVSPKAAFAFSSKLAPKVAYKFVLKQLAGALDEEDMDEIEQQIESWSDNGIPLEKLLDSITGITFYCDTCILEEGKLQEIIETTQDLDEEEAIPHIISQLPKTSLIITTKNDLCWKTLKDFIAEAEPEMIQDDKIVPIEGIVIFQSGNYLILTNEEAAIRKRIAGNGADLTSNEEFAKMLKLVDKDFTDFAWVSEDYYKSIESIMKELGNLSDDFADDKFSGIFSSFGFSSALATTKFSADGVLATSITSDLQIALLSSDTIPGFIAGLLPYAGPIAKVVMEVIDEIGSNDDDDDDDDDDMDAAILGARKFVASMALDQLRESNIPSDAVFFAIGEDDLVWVKWNTAEESLDKVPEDSEETEFPYVFVTSPSAAEKADSPEETVVFFEDPTENVDGIYFVFGDDSIVFLEGDFDTYSEAAEAAVNSFDISDSAAKKLLKKAAAIDEMMGL